ncbi:MAG: hypothetical protein PHP44_07080 [Kiritimatiellae bacterium]|nr:hypothetical protein [Kiritimatiellia bacterium]MDD4735851.1 hypothetical protein [Kiritimatiellia bacterium]
MTRIVRMNKRLLLLLLLLGLGRETVRSAALLEDKPEPPPTPAATEQAIEHTGLKLDAIRTQLDEYAPDAEAAADAWLIFLEVDNLSMQKRWEEAVAVLGTYTNASVNPYWLYKRALLNVSLEKWMDAESDFAASIQSGLDYSETHYRQLQVLFFAGAMDEYLAARRTSSLSTETYPLLLLADRAAATKDSTETCDWLNALPIPQRCSILVLIAQYYHALSRSVHAQLVSEIKDCVISTGSEEESHSPHRELRDYARRLWDEHMGKEAE